MMPTEAISRASLQNMAARRERGPLSTHHRHPHGQNMLQQSLASCDLQASFQRDDTRNPQETSNRTKTMIH